jgi:hypothetical protein
MRDSLIVQVLHKTLLQARTAPFQKPIGLEPNCNAGAPPGCRSSKPVGGAAGLASCACCAASSGVLVGELGPPHFQRDAVSSSAATVMLRLLSEALMKGASCCRVKKHHKHSNGNMNYCVVDSTTSALEVILADPARACLTKAWLFCAC